MNSSRMNVDSVDSRPRKILMQPTATNAVLGTLNKYETGYIIGVMAQLEDKQHITVCHQDLMKFMCHLHSRLSFTLVRKLSLEI